MATTGASFVQNGVNTGASGTNWTNPGNITANDSSYAAISCSSIGSSTQATAQSKILRGYTLGFNIPGTATVTGIKLYIDRAVSALTDLGYPLGGNLASASGTIYLYDNTSVISSTGQSLNLADSSGAFSVQSIGGDGNLLGSNTSVLTPALINSSTFGVGIDVYLEAPVAYDNIDQAYKGTSVDVSIDYVQVEVFYTESGGGGGGSSSSSSKGGMFLVF